jgi:hypothetical protein
MKINIILFFAMIGLTQHVNGQCFPDRHNTTWFDGWVSCETAESPNPNRESGHWILYDFELLYELGAMHIWNSNDPSHLDRGMREVTIDYSADGEKWFTAGNFTFVQATGHNTYEGFDGPDLQGLQARFLLITAVSNWGGECFGLSEFNIEGKEVIISATEDPTTELCFDARIFPNPFAESARVAMHSECNGQLNATVYDMLGKVVWSRSYQVGGADTQFSISGQNMPPGTYILQLELDGQVDRKKFVKLESR